MSGPIGPLVNRLLGGSDEPLPRHPWRQPGVDLEEPSWTRHDATVVENVDGWSDHFAALRHDHEARAIEGDEAAALETLVRQWRPPGRPGAEARTGPNPGDYADRVGAAVEAVDADGEKLGPEGRRAVSTLHAAFSTDGLDDPEAQADRAIARLDDALDRDLSTGPQTIDAGEYADVDRRDELAERARSSSHHRRASEFFARCSRLDELPGEAVADHADAVADAVRAAREVRSVATTGQLDAETPVEPLGTAVETLAATPAHGEEVPPDMDDTYAERFDALRESAAGVESAKLIVST